MVITLAWHNPGSCGPVTNQKRTRLATHRPMDDGLQEIAGQIKVQQLQVSIKYESYLQ